MVRVERQRYGAWFYSYLVDDFSDEILAGSESAVNYSCDEVFLSISCSSFGTMLNIHLNDGGMFHNGEIELRWMGGAKDGEIESYTFIYDDGISSLTAPLLEVDSIISSLKSHSELRLRFRRRRDPVFTTDRVSLNGAARAIDSLPCMNP